MFVFQLNATKTNEAQKPLVYRSVTDFVQNQNIKNGDYVLLLMYLKDYAPKEFYGEGPKERIARYNGYVDYEKKAIRTERSKNCADHEYISRMKKEIRETKKEIREIKKNPEKFFAQEAAREAGNESKFDENHASAMVGYQVGNRETAYYVGKADNVKLETFNDGVKIQEMVLNGQMLAGDNCLMADSKPYMHYHTNNFGLAKLEAGVTSLFIRKNDGTEIIGTFTGARDFMITVEKGGKDELIALSDISILEIRSFEKEIDPKIMKKVEKLKPGTKVAITLESGKVVRGEYVECNEGGRYDPVSITIGTKNGGVEVALKNIKSIETPEF